jgi:hypothetical protein
MPEPDLRARTDAQPTSTKTKNFLTGPFQLTGSAGVLWLAWLSSTLDAASLKDQFWNPTPTSGYNPNRKTNKNQNPTSTFGKKEESSISDWWSGTYLKGLTSPEDLQQRGTFGGPLKKKKRPVLTIPCMYIFISPLFAYQKIPSCVYFGGPKSGKCCYILLPFGIFYGHLEYFMYGHLVHFVFTWYI